MEADSILEVVNKFLQVFVFKSDDRGRYIESEWDYLKKMIKSPKTNMQRINAYFHVVQEKNAVNQKLSFILIMKGKIAQASKRCQ